MESGGAVPHGSVSVVLPCFNAQATLAASAASVLESAVVGELLIVDDGSSDATVAVAGSLVDQRVRVLSQPFPMGRGATIRRGLAEVRKDFVIVSDTDCRHAWDHCSTLLEPLADGRADAVYGSYRAGDPQGPGLFRWQRGLTALSDALRRQTCCQAFRRAVIQAIDIEEDGSGFQVEVTAKLAAAGARIHHVSMPGRADRAGTAISWRDGGRAAYCAVKYAPGRLRRRGHEPASFDQADVQLAETLDNLDDVSGQYAGWIAEMLEPHLGEHVVEIGAGHGTITAQMRRPGRSIVASDLAPRCVQVLTQRFADSPDVTVLQGGLHDLSRAPDSVVLVNVLEHVPDDVALLTEIRTTLRPGGTVLLYVPAFPGLYSDFDRRIGHLRRYRRSTLGTAMARAGLVVSSIRYVNAPGLLAWWLVAKKLGRTPTDRGLAGVYDRFVVPVVKRVEAGREMPFGQSLLAVGVAPGDHPGA